MLTDLCHRVVQRQHWLLTNTPLSEAAAYDKARKELYRIRHFCETEQRVAREEAQNVGAYFGLGPLEVGMQLENKAYEDWKAWAIREAAALKQLSAGAYSGIGTEEGEEDMTPDTEGQSEALQAVRKNVPGSKRGQEAKGGAVVHP